MRQIEKVADAYFEAVYDTDRAGALAVIDEAIAEGRRAEDLVFHVVLPSLHRMLEAFMAGDGASLSQHFIAAKVSSEVVDKLLPRFSVSPAGNAVVVMGTARGDFHGLGKKIVAGCLTANLVTVHDIGMNVAPEKFVDEAVRLNADVIGVSSMMMHTAIGDEGPRAVRRILEERGLEQQIRLIVGGAPYRFDENLYLEVGADGYADSALEAIGLVERMVSEVTGG